MCLCLVWDPQGQLHEEREVSVAVMGTRRNGSGSTEASEGPRKEAQGRSALGL